MPRGKSALALALALAGCAPAPEVVRLDVSAPASLSSSPMGLPGFDRRIPGASAVIPAGEEQSVASRLDSRSVGEALGELAQEQSQELAMLTERLYTKKVGALSTTRADELAVAAATYANGQEKVWDEASAAFFAQADAMGRDRVRLASLVGFPDPDPRSRRRVKRGDLAGQSELEQAASLRQQIARREEDFWNKIEAIRAPVRSVYVDKLRQIAATFALADQRARQDASAEAADILSGASSDIETPSVDFGVFIPAAGFERATVPAMGVNAPTGEVRPAKAAQSPATAVFLKLKNYRLARPGEPARDVTKEFAAWNRQHSVGP